MSLEDDSLQEDDPIERERKQVLQELEIVVQQKSSQQVIMEKIRAEIGELEASVPPNSINQSMIDHEAHFWFWAQHCMISKKLKLSTSKYSCVTFIASSDQSELAASLEEEEMLKKQERDLQEKLAHPFKEN